jgi:predicted Holliday junction resolvase-like endonuclease
MFAEELPPISPTSHSTEANFIGAPIDFLVFRGMKDIVAHVSVFNHDC